MFLNGLFHKAAWFAVLPGGRRYYARTLVPKVPLQGTLVEIQFVRATDEDVAGACGQIREVVWTKSHDLGGGSRFLLHGEPHRDGKNEATVRA